MGYGKGLVEQGSCSDGLDSDRPVGAKFWSSGIHMISLCLYGTVQSMVR